jgi:hypothetical protein
MLMIKERRPSTRTIEGWATSVLLEAGAIRECEEHGWMKVGPIRMLGSERWKSPERTRHRTFPKIRRLPRSSMS